MSKRAPLPSVLTANRLGDGAAVFLDFEGAWNENIAEALVGRSPEEVRALEDRGAHDAARNLVVEPYLIDVEEAGGRIVPVRYRERVRAGGPTILGDVPGYVAPSPRASLASPHAPSARGEEPAPDLIRGRGEGQTQTPTSAFLAAPHPSPLPASGERGHGEREPLVEAA
jgi:hypothetical protein